MNKISMDKKLVSMQKRYKTRDGCDVRVLCVDSLNPYYPVVAAVTYFVKGVKFEDIISFTEYGMFKHDGKESIYDLIEQPEEHTIDVWAVMFQPQQTWSTKQVAIFTSEQDIRDYAYHRGFGIKAMKKFTLKLTEGDTLKEGEME